MRSGRSERARESARSGLSSYHNYLLSHTLALDSARLQLLSGPVCTLSPGFSPARLLRPLGLAYRSHLVNEHILQGSTDSETLRVAFAALRK